MASTDPGVLVATGLPDPKPSRWTRLGSWYPRTPRSKWAAGGFSLLLAVLVGWGISRPGVLTLLFQRLVDNLPLTLPILTVVLAVVLSPQQLGTLKGWLALSGTLALGVVNFAIWYVVAAQTAEPWVRVSQQRVITKDYALVFLLVSFCWAGFCSVFGALAERENNLNIRWIIGQVTLLGLSTAFLFSPFFLLQTRADIEKRTGVSLDMKHFSVSIAYRDAELIKYVGRLPELPEPLTQCVVFRQIAAKLPSEAIAIGLNQFRSSSRGFQFQPPNRRQRDDPRRPVEVLETWTLAEEEK